VPFVRFQVEQELEKGDLQHAEGKDKVIERLRPVFAVLPPSALREELLAHVADRMDLAPSLVSSWLPAPGSGGGSSAARSDARVARGAPSSPVAPPAPRLAAAASPVAKAERAFLAQCLATPDAAPEILAGVGDEVFTSDAVRRVAAHVREHLRAPQDGLSDDDEMLRRAVAALVADASLLTPSRAALQGQLANLQLLRIDRQIADAKAAGMGGIVELRRRRDHLVERRDALIAEAMEESAPPAV
jgi:DNA primase